MSDVVDGLLAVASVRRAVAKVKPPLIYRALVTSRLCAKYGLARGAVEAMLAMPGDRAPSEVYDLPSSHYAAKGRVADQLASALVFRPEALTCREVASLSLESVRWHSLGLVLMSLRVTGLADLDGLCRNVPLEDLAEFVRLYQVGESHPWYAEMYAAELSRLLRIEAAFRAALR